MGCKSLAAKYPDDINGDYLLQEIIDCTILLTKRSTEPDLSPIGILKFIVSFGGNDVFPNLAIALQILSTISVSVSSCERSFSKLKLILTYLRSTMSESAYKFSNSVHRKRKY